MYEKYRYIPPANYGRPSLEWLWKIVTAAGKLETESSYFSWISVQ